MYSHVPLPLCPAPYWPWTSAVFILTNSTVYSHVPLPLCPAPYWPWTSAVFILTIQHCVQSCTTTTVSSTLLAMDFSCVHTDNTALCTVMYHYHCVQHPMHHTQCTSTAVCSTGTCVCSGHVICSTVIVQP